ncbi:ABC transporter substrate-binding protein [Aquabacter spiritensis]|uniref:Iron complex transport system substrate-binding protein n=1 Tax=Aquabacter spiritensis TaxID=933073 RepID=A0A4R3LYY9_9HYPH|nr:ABC transporter substrate-binding protein [Aquabacter spiritensis]TCT05476.1 iron complex transport system substrate-binding protein [Aquabacter spiritensis]
MTRLTRRGLLAAAALGLGVRGAGSEAPRFATLDWALLETLLAMGVTPVAAAELVLFRAVAVEPPVPPRVVDIGLRGTPSFEALRLARPSLIFSSNYYAEMEPKLRRIAPVETISVYARGDPPFARAEDAARRLGTATGREGAARDLIAATHAGIERARDDLKRVEDRPLIVVNLGDARHFRVFGPDSMFGEVLARLGRTNAWRARTFYSASAPIGIEALARFPEAWIVVLPPVPPDARRLLPESAMWAAFPSVQAGRVLQLGAMNPFGGLPTAQRFARLLSAALLDPAGARFD